MSRQLRYKGLTIHLRDNVFVPTAETYALIDIAREKITELGASSIADIGTGTGIIALTLAKAFPNKQFFATDTNEEALALARYNAEQNALFNIRFLHNDPDTWISPQLPTPIDFIVSNPPYIGDEEYCDPQFLERYPKAAQEPQDAIRTYDQLGVRPYVRILTESERLQTTGYVFQCNGDYFGQLREHITRPEFQISITQDDSGNVRFLFMRRHRGTDCYA